MKLYNIYYLCKNCIDICQELNISRKKDTADYYIENWSEYKKILEQLQKIELFSNITYSIYRLVPSMVVDKIQPIISAERKDSILGYNNNLVLMMQTVIDLYDSMNLKMDGKGIDIKIPECNDLKEYMAYLKELDFVFCNCPYLLCENEKIKFSSVDVGSNWLTFIIEISVAAGVVAWTGSIILKNLAAIMDSVLVLKSHLVSIKRDEQLLRLSEKKGDLIDSELEIFDKLKKIYINQATESLESQLGEISDPEDKTKLEKSLEKLSNLLDKGIEIQASIDLPLDVQLLFPEVLEQQKISSDILKYLEEKNSEE